VSERWSASLDRQAPADWYPGPPDFIGIGVQKAGTSWWYRILESHPQVFRRHWQKELHFFDRFGTEEFTDDDAARYAELFCRPLGGVSGEWTPRYICDFWVPPLIARAAPNAKLLVLLRDPVARYLSGVRHGVQLANLPVHVAERDAFWRGMYHAQLRNYLRFFPTERILVQLYEKCLAEPEREAQRLFEFLELDRVEFRPPNFDVTYNPSRGESFSATPSALEALTELYRDDMAALADDFDVDLGWWKSWRA
jgi:sulfotransferase family protein